MDSFYGGRPGRDFGVKNYNSYATMINDTTLPLSGYGIVTTEADCILYQKRYNGEEGQVEFIIISSLKGPKGDPGGGEASDIIYDGTVSTLIATNVQSAIDELASDFQDGCDIIMQAVIAKGQTPASNSPEDIANAIDDITTSWPGLQTPLEFDWNCGWVSGPTWTYQYPTDCYLDIYEVQANHEYQLMLGNTVGTRCMGMVTSVDVRTKTSGWVTGTQIISKKDSDVIPNLVHTFISEEDGYFVLQKDNMGTTGIMTYIMDKTALP